MINMFRRIDVNSNVVFCHHHKTQIDYYTQFKSGDTTVDNIPKHWQDEVKE